mmetsp:Transcript_4758/g.15869  ORF Transcript_4758/g.15869 Transcript_4758/m.15869 type:complete len:212 (-) Transcript_4758:56-691(-)
MTSTGLTMMNASALSSKSASFARRGAIAGRKGVESASSNGRRSMVVYAKGKGQGNRAGRGMPGQGGVEQFLPPIDPDNEQFVIYVRSKKGLKVWYPLNVVTGGSAANTLVKGLDNDMSKSMALKSLSQNIGQAIYKDFEAINKVARTMPMLKQAKEIEYGFGVLDKENPRSMFTPSKEKVWMIPSEEECLDTPANKLQEAGDNLKKMFGQN